MADFVFDTYFENLAVKLKDIAHDTSAAKTTRFHRVSGMVNFEEVLQNFSSNTGMQLVIQNNMAGSFTDNKSDNIIEDPYYLFYLVKKVDGFDMGDRNTQIAACKAAMKKILSRIRYDKKRNLNGLLYFDYNSVRYDTVGPIANNFYGVWCSFTLTEAANLVIDRNDWTDGDGFDEMI